MGSDFLRVERNFTIGQSPKIWANFSKIYIKINKKLTNYWENSRTNANLSEIVLIFGRALIFNYGKNKEYNMES